MMRTLTNSPSTFTIQKTAQSLKDGSASKNLSAPKTASVQKFALAYASQLREHSSPNFLHGTRYIGTWYMKGSTPKPFRSQNRVASKIRLAPAPQLREHSSPNFLHGTRYMVHGTSTWSISKPFHSQNRVASKIRLAPAPQLREQSSPNFLHGAKLPTAVRLFGQKRSVCPQGEQP